MYEKGDLVAFHTVVGTVILGVCLGRERTKEKYDEHGYGGLFVGQIQVLIVRSHRETSIGKKLWIDRKNVRIPSQWISGKME